MPNNETATISASHRLRRSLELWSLPLVVDLYRTIGRSSIQLARWLTSLGTIYDDIGRHEAARRNYEEAVSLIVRERGKGAYALPTAVYNIGASYYSEGRVADALDYMERALRCSNETPESPESLRIVILQHLAQIHHEMRRFKSAEEEYAELLKLDGKSGQHVKLWALQNLALLMWETGRSDESVKNYDLFVAMLESASYNTLIDEGTRLGAYNAAITYLEVGSLERAESILLALVSWFDNSHTHAGRELGLVLQALGRVYQKQNNLPQARTSYERANQVIDYNATKKVEILYDLALVLDDMGEVANAEKVYEEILEATRIAERAPMYITLSALRNLADLYLKRGADVKAEHLYMELARLSIPREETELVKSWLEGLADYAEVLESQRRIDESNRVKSQMDHWREVSTSGEP